MRPRMMFGSGMVLGSVLTCGFWIGADWASTAARAESATASQKNTSEVVLENDRVRVVEATFYPGDDNPGMHTHELPHVGVVIEGGTLLFRSPDGETETMTLAAGGVGYRGANVTHEPINTGDAPVRVIEVELK